MIKGKWKLLICTIFVACIFFIASSDVFAAINMDYYEENVANNPVIDNDLDSKLADNPITSALGSLIYSVGSLMERALGIVFQFITGTNMFPWADAILFNAIPFLDVNVFNPSGASLIAKVQDYIAGTYYTILSLASAFFGVAVMVSAIKLVLTAIAEDKARYKKAIVDWLLGLVMLWGIHFFISFVLYLNEELVVVASNIAKETLESAETEIEYLSDVSEKNALQLKGFINQVLAGGVTLGDVFDVVLYVVRCCFSCCGYCCALW